MSNALAVSLGAALGALMRWTLGVALDALAPAMPGGTLAANLIGGYLVGIAVGVFDRRPRLPPAWRLFAITGFLGGLTTFSTFSAEVASHLVAGRVGWAGLEIATHLVGSVVLTLLGIATVGALSREAARDDGAEALERLAEE